MVSSGFVLATLALTAVTVPQVANAHGYIATPKSEFKSGASQSSWVAEFSSPWGGSKWSAADFAKTAPGKGFATTRAFLESRGPTCGNTLSTATPKAIPSDNTVKFSRAIVHPGPCELWIDDTRVYHNDDCEAAFGSSIPTWKIDFSACKGSCMLRFYWLGLQDGGARFQSYKNCIPLSGSGGSSSKTTTKESSSSNKKSPTPTTKAPKKTKAPAKTKSRSMDEVDDDEVGADADDEELTSEDRAANSTLGVKCKTKTKRN